MNEIQQLIPFKVELSPLEDLISEAEWFEIEKGRLNFSEDFLRRMGDNVRGGWPVRELEKKMIPHAFRQVFTENYNRWKGQYTGEWIIVGKQGSYYLAAQPKKVVRVLPAGCCRFVGLM